MKAVGASVSHHPPFGGLLKQGSTYNFSESEGADMKVDS